MPAHPRSTVWRHPCFVTDCAAGYRNQQLCSTGGIYRHAHASQGNASDTTLAWTCGGRGPIKCRANPRLHAIGSYLSLH
eukprot:6800224-Pyramimonas_sp.AAC.1